MIATKVRGFGVILFKLMFSKDTMSGYIQWLGDIHFPFASKMAYVGKIAEMVGGLSLILGFCDGQASGGGVGLADIKY
ncbi:MAG: DoxX family membrane protein [Saprospiraceae bacterium]|nr:DoxX family membrane protein [Saprospiraceae bacterium]